MITTTSILIGIIGFLIGVNIGILISVKYNNRNLKKLHELHDNYQQYLKEQSEFHRSNLEMLKSLDRDSIGKMEVVSASIPEFLDKIFEQGSPFDEKKMKDDMRKQLIKALKGKDAKFDPEAPLEELQKLWDLLQ